MNDVFLETLNLHSFVSIEQKKYINRVALWHQRLSNKYCSDSVHDSEFSKKVLRYVYGTRESYVEFVLIILALRNLWYSVCVNIFLWICLLTLPLWKVNEVVYIVFLIMLLKILGVRSFEKIQYIVLTNFQ